MENDMSIIYVKNKSNGKTYAYESVSVWVPEKKQPRCKRTYLGVVDDKTGKIIPTSHQRGRKKDSQKKEPKIVNKSSDLQTLLHEKDMQINVLAKENHDLKMIIQKIRTLIDC